MATASVSPNSASITMLGASLSFAPLSGASPLGANVSVSPTAGSTTGAPTPAPLFSPPRRSRRALQAAHSQPVSEVGMWKARSVAAQAVVDDKVGALDAYRTSDVGPSRVAFQHQADVATNAIGWLAQLRTTVDGSLTLLGADTTASMLRMLHTVTQDVAQLVTSSSAVVTSRDKEAQLLDDALRATQDLAHCLRSRCEAMETEYKKLLVAAEKHEGILSKARTYVKVVMAERLAWQEAYGANAAKLPLTVTSDFVKRCQRTLDMFQSAQVTHALASIVPLEQTSDSIKRYQHRVNDRLNEGAVLLRYVPPAEEIQLLDQTLKTSGSDVALHKELADRERKFDRVKDDMFDRCSSALQTVQSTRAALQSLSDQLRRMRNDDIIGQLSNRILNAISIASSGLAMVVVGGGGGGGSAAASSSMRSTSISAAAVAVDAASTLARRRDTTVMMGRSSSIVMQQQQPHSPSAQRKSVRIAPASAVGGGGGSSSSASTTTGAAAVSTSPSRGSRLMSATSMVMALQSVARREQLLKLQHQPAETAASSSPAPATVPPGSGGAPSSSMRSDSTAPLSVTPPAARTESPQAATHDGGPAAALPQQQGAGAFYARGKAGSVVALQEGGGGIGGFRSPSLQPLDLASPSGSWTPRYGRHQDNDLSGSTVAAANTLDAHRQVSCASTTAATTSDSIGSGSQREWQPQQLPSPTGSAGAAQSAGREGRARSVFVVDSLETLHRQRSDSGTAGVRSSLSGSSFADASPSSRRISSAAVSGDDGRKLSAGDPLSRSANSFNPFTSTASTSVGGAEPGIGRRSSSAAFRPNSPSPLRADSSSSLTPDASLAEAAATLPPRQARVSSKVKFHETLPDVTVVPATTPASNPVANGAATPGSVQPLEGIIVPRKGSSSGGGGGSRGVEPVVPRRGSLTNGEEGVFNVGMPVAGGGRGTAEEIGAAAMQSPAEVDVEVGNERRGPSSASVGAAVPLRASNSSAEQGGVATRAAVASRASRSSSVPTPRGLPSWNVDHPLPDEELSEAERQLAEKLKRTVIPANIQMVFDGIDAPTFTVDLTHYGVTRQYRRQESMNGKLAEALQRAETLEAQSERLALTTQQQASQLETDRRRQELIEEHADFSQKVNRAALRAAGLGSAQNRKGSIGMDSGNRLATPLLPSQGKELPSGRRGELPSVAAAPLRRESSGGSAPFLPPAPPGTRAAAAVEPLLEDLSRAVAVAVRPATVGGAPPRRRSTYAMR